MFISCSSELTQFAIFVPAHGGRGGGRRPIPRLPWFLPGGFPSHSLHRVQRCPGNVPLLCQQVQLLADHGGAAAAVCQRSSLRDSQGGAAPDSRQPLPGVHEELVGTEMQRNGNSLCQPRLDSAGCRRVNSPAWFVCV